jgi:hypothetical protein
MALAFCYTFEELVQYQPHQHGCRQATICARTHSQQHQVGRRSINSKTTAPYFAGSSLR